MFAQQDGKCAICKLISKQKLCVDHDHSTGKVRGLLCKKCNWGIGLFGDKPNFLRTAADYLESSGFTSGGRFSTGTAPSEPGISE
jgi:hypothetical protein